MLDDIIAYESGVLDEEATIDLFQRLIDNGMAWSLQGHYGAPPWHSLRPGIAPSLKPRELSSG